MRKIENEENINDYKEYETDYKEMDKLTKDEVIERYFYRIQKEFDSKMNTRIIFDLKVNTWVIIFVIVIMLLMMLN